jgi:hypothetical protein
VLKQAGLVDVQARAQQRLYELRGQSLRELHDWLERYRKLWDALLAAKRRLAQPGSQK